MRDEDFERLYEAHAESLLAFLVYRTGDRNMAEDLLADTFERVLRARRRFDPRKASEKTWLYTIALNGLKNRRRGQAAQDRAMTRAAGGLAAPADAFEGVDRRDWVLRALVSLSEEEREAISLRFGADLTVPEIARLTGFPLTTIEGRVYRGMRKLRTALE